jgi:hypothetical protein
MIGPAITMKIKPGDFVTIEKEDPAELTTLVVTGWKDGEIQCVEMGSEWVVTLVSPERFEALRAQQQGA